MKLRDLLVCGFCFAAGLLFATAGAAADRRVALVIGNSTYKNASSLPNTINDSTVIATLFRSVGFEVVISRADLGVVDFKRAVREFLLTAENADIAVVYYAGHGVEIGGTNYLVPVDAKLGRDYDVEDEAVALDRIIWALQSVRRLRLILLDACRDNPFPGKMRSAGIRSTMKGGLAKIEDVSADTLVAYAAKAGSVSYDGDGVNSPYAAALVRHIAEPGLDIRIALGRVRDEVIGMTGGRQEPFIYGSLGGATIALVPAGATKTEPVTAARLEPVTTARASPASNAAGGKPPDEVIAKVEPTRQQPTAPVQATTDPALLCKRDEQRLERLRVEPSQDEVVKFQRELFCVRLKPQVQRLLESLATGSGPAVDGASRPPTAPQTQAQATPAVDICKRDAEQLARLRADPSAEGIARFERELGCEHIRPQLRRLRESLGL